MGEIKNYYGLLKNLQLRGEIVAMDDIDRELEKYQKTLEDEKKKAARINWGLFLILIVVIILFVYSLWRYQVLN